MNHSSYFWLTSKYGLPLHLLSHQLLRFLIYAWLEGCLIQLTLILNLQLLLVFLSLLLFPSYQLFIKCLRRPGVRRPFISLLKLTNILFLLSLPVPFDLLSLFLQLLLLLIQDSFISLINWLHIPNNLGGNRVNIRFFL